MLNDEKDNRKDLTNLDFHNPRDIKRIEKNEKHKERTKTIKWLDRCFTSGIERNGIPAYMDYVLENGETIRITASRIKDSRTLKAFQEFLGHRNVNMYMFTLNAEDVKREIFEWLTSEHTQRYRAPLPLEVYDYVEAVVDAAIDVQILEAKYRTDPRMGSMFSDAWSFQQVRAIELNKENMADRCRLAWRSFYKRRIDSEERDFRLDRADKEYKQAAADIIALAPPEDLPLLPPGEELA